MHLSKSDYLKYKIHPAYLWYHKNKPRKLPRITDNEKYVFEQGHLFESLVQRLFTDATTIEGDSRKYADLISSTQAAIEAGATTLFQASFMTDEGLYCRSDVLQKTSTGGWILTEIKSSTSVKRTHLLDLAFQAHVLKTLGYKVEACRVIYVNRNYVLDGELIPERITATRDVTDQVESLAGEVAKDIKDALSVTEQAEVDDHPCFAGSLGAWLPIYFHLHPELSDDSPLRLAQLKPKLAREVYFEGIKSMSELEDKVNNYELTPKQLSQIRAVKRGSPVVDTKAVSDFMNSLKFPLYFLDYETSAHVLPLYDQTKPYQQIPFQYSLHVLRSAEAELEHYEYVHAEMSLPVKQLAQKLVSEIGDEGTVLAWFDKFEKHCNRTIANLAPEFEDAMQKINKRMLDLRTPFANDSYVDARFNGSSSIKKVLPVIVPDLSYKKLAIQEGGAAQRLWQQIWDGSRKSEKEQILNDLLSYCKLDTLAMVEIYRFLTGVAGTSNKAVQAELF